MNYYEKLKDPRWQKKRLEAMQANDFCCEVCGGSKSTLHVHHKEYFKGFDPWDYNKEQLSVLCDECHESYHSKPDILKLVCSYVCLDGPSNREELSFLIAGYMGNIDYKTLVKAGGVSDCIHNKASFDAGFKAKTITDKLSKKYYDDLRKKLDLENKNAK